MREIKPPESWLSGEGEPFATRLFLGGTIDQGNSADWQFSVVTSLSDIEGLIVYNPRRDDWNKDLPNDPTKGSTFYEQVMWEMKAQDYSDFKLYHFEPNSLSPITLLELGSWATSWDTVVSCSPDYSRYGNVKLYCEHNDIPFFEALDEALQELRSEYL